MVNKHEHILTVNQGTLHESDKMLFHVNKMVPCQYRRVNEVDIHVLFPTELFLVLEKSAQYA